MSVNDQNLKVRADFFIEKLAEYIEKGNKNFKPVNIIDPSIKNHRLLLTPFQIKEIGELIVQAKEKKSQEPLKKVEEILISPDSNISYFNDKLVKKLQYNPETNSFSLTESMVEILSPPKQSFEVRGLSDISDKQYQKITDKGLKSKSNPGKAVISDSKINTYTKIKADSFVKKITDLNTTNEKTDDNLIIEEKKYLRPVLLNFIIGQTHKKEFLDMMNNYSNIKYTKNSHQNFLIYHDLSITAYFDSDEKLEELEFSESFSGCTKKGLRLRDSVSKAVKTYGNPVSSDDYSIKWHGLKITYTNSIVNSISLTDNIETFYFEKNFLINNFSVYTDGLLLGLILNNSTKSIILNGNDKNYIIEFMKDYSHLKLSDNYLASEAKQFSPSSLFGNNKENSLNYSDVGITFHFDKDNLLTSFDLRENFTGQTIKGLKIGDKVEKAIKLYGISTESQDYLSYKRMKIYHNNNFITCINVFRDNK